MDPDKPFSLEDLIDKDEWEPPRTDEGSIWMRFRGYNYKIAVAQWFDNIIMFAVVWSVLALDFMPTRPVMEGLLGRHGDTTYAAQYWLKIYQPEQRVFRHAELLGHRRFVHGGRHTLRRPLNEYHDLGREGEARGLLVRRPSRRARARRTATTIFTRATRASPTGTAGSAARRTACCISPCSGSRA